MSGEEREIAELCEELFKDEEFREVCSKVIGKKYKGILERYKKISEDRVISREYEEIVAFLKKYKVVPKEYSPPKLVIKREEEVKKEAYEKIEKVLLIPIVLEELAALCKIIDDFVYPNIIFKFSNVYTYPTPFTQASYLFWIAGLLSLSPLFVYAFMELRDSWSGIYYRKERKIEVRKEKTSEQILAHELFHDIIGRSETKATACAVITVWLKYLSEANNEEGLKEREEAIETWCHLRGKYLYKFVNKFMYKIFGRILSMFPYSYKFSYYLGGLYGYFLLLEKLKNNNLKPEDLGMMIENIKNQSGIEIYKQVKKLGKLLLTESLV